MMSKPYYTVGANVYHVPGVVLLGIGGDPSINIKITTKNDIFTFSFPSLKLSAEGVSYYANRFC